MFASISNSIRVPWVGERSDSPGARSSSTEISGSLVSVSMISSKYCARSEFWVRDVIFAGFPEVF